MQTGQEKLHNTSPQIKVVTEEILPEVSECIAHNLTINEHPEYLSNFMVRDAHAIIKLFKYEDFATSDGGIIIDNDMEFTADSTGQIKGRRSVIAYQARGIIVSVGDIDNPNKFQQRLKPGTVVRLLSNNLGKEFDTEPQTKGTNNLGYFLVHLGQICGVEN